MGHRCRGGFPDDGLTAAFSPRAAQPPLDLGRIAAASRGEPDRLQCSWRTIVCTPKDAFRCFMGTEIEVVAAGSWFLVKEVQDLRLRLDYKNSFSPD